MVESTPTTNPEESEKIVLQVKRVADQDSVKVRVKLDTQFRKLFKQVREKFGITGSVTFVFDGDIIRETDTARSLNMEEDDLIDVREEQ